MYKYKLVNVLLQFVYILLSVVQKKCFDILFICIKELLLFRKLYFCFKLAVKQIEIIKNINKMAKETKKNQGMDAEEMLSRSETFIEKNKKSIIGVVLAVIVIIVCIVLYNNFYKDPREEAASAALAKGEVYFQAGNYETALNGDSINYFGFNKIIDEYSGTDAANLAKAYAGLSLAQTGKYEEAIKYLEDFSGSDDYLSASVMAATGNCYANIGKVEKAASLLAKAAKKADAQSLSPVWYKQAGILYENLGNKAEALKCYKAVKENYSSNMMVAGDIDKYIERVSE